MILLVGWFAALLAWQPAILKPLDRMAGLSVGLDLLGSESVPAFYSPQPFALMGLAVMILVWILGNAWRWKRRET